MVLHSNTRSIEIKFEAIRVEPLKILVATQYSKIDSHLGFSDIISCSTMLSVQ